MKRAADLTMTGVALVGAALVWLGWRLAGGEKGEDR